MPAHTHTTSAPVPVLSVLCTLRAELPACSSRYNWGWRAKMLCIRSSCREDFGTF